MPEVSLRDRPQLSRRLCRRTAGGSLRTSSSYAAVSLKFDGATGAEIWRQLEPDGTALFEANALAFDPAGDILSVGNGLRVARTGADTGEVGWWQDVDGHETPFGNGHAVAVGASGEVVAAGVLGNMPDTRPARRGRNGTHSQPHHIGGGPVLPAPRSQRERAGQAEGLQRATNIGRREPVHARP